MKSIQIAIAATTLFATLSAAGLSQANEVSEFPIATSSHVSRADVRAEAQAANKAGKLRYDLVGSVTMPSVEPMSHKSREEVRREALERDAGRSDRSSYSVGGL